MEWLIGIIAVILVVYFWPIFLPLGVIGGLIIWAMIASNESDSEKRREEAARKEREIASTIYNAKQNASSKDKVWRTYTETDPASGKQIPRGAVIESNDGLCTLTLERRINGNELADLNCPHFKISEYNDVEIKFDNRNTSDKMELSSYSDSDHVYIDDYQATYSNNLDYKTFIKRLSTANAVSIKIETSNAGTHWITFSLKGSTKAINLLYSY